MYVYMYVCVHTKTEKEYVYIRHMEQMLTKGEAG